MIIGPICMCRLFLHTASKEYDQNPEKCVFFFLSKIRFNFFPKIQFFLPFTLFLIIRECVQHGVFFDFHMGVRPEVVSAHIYKSNPHYVDGICNCTWRTEVIWKFGAADLTCLNSLERGGSICEVTHRWSHALVNPLGVLSLDIALSPENFQDFSQMTVTAVRFCV